MSILLPLVSFQRTELGRTEKSGHHDIVTEGDIVSQRIAMAGLGKTELCLPRPSPSDTALSCISSGFPDK